MIENFSSSAATPVPANQEVRLRRPGRAQALAFLTLGALALGAWTAPAVATEAASLQLSDGHPFSDVDIAVTLPQISPNGEYAVYGQDAVTDSAFELWSVPVAGGNPVRLSDVLSAGQHVTFAISPNSARVVYVVDQDTPGRAELYSVPIAGGVVTKLNPALSPNRGVLNFKISPTSDRVFFICDLLTDSMFELYTVPIAGGNASRLNHELLFDYDVEGYQATPNGQTVLYRAGRTDSGDWELYSVDADGQGPIPVKLNLHLPNNGAVDPYFQISPNSARVVYLADASVDGQFDIYSVSVSVAGSTKLNSTLPSGASVGTDFLISANSSKVVYRADQTAANVFQLYSSGLTGGGATRLNGPLLSTEDVSTGFRISADSTKVVYRSDERVNDVIELWSVPIGGGTPTRLNGELVDPGGDVLDHALSSDGARVVYSADQNVDSLNELWSVPIGGGTAIRLNRTLANGGDVQNFRISQNSNWVVYGADQDSDTVDELLAVPIAGGTVQDVSGPLVNQGDVLLKVVQTTAWGISSNSLDVVYMADEDVNDELELYASSLGGPPSAPTGVVAVAGNALATVTFVPPTSNGGSPITGYTVTPSPATSGWVDNNAGSILTNHVIQGLTNGTAYTFTVRATNANGTGVPSVPSNVATPATVPNPPTAVAAIPRNLGADVAFVPPLNNGGSGITGYTVTPSPATVGWADNNAGSTTTVHAITGLSTEIQYTFTVTATNSAGTGSPSSPSNPVTPGCNIFCDGVESNDTSSWSAALTLPGAPTTVVAVAGDASATVTFVAPLIGGGSPISGYTVTSSGGGVDSNAGSTGLSHVVTGLTNGTSYTFTVRATNSSGQGPASAASNAVTPATVPGAPTAVFAVAGDSSATVTFVPPADDGGAAITGYTVISDPPGGTDSNAGSTGLSHAITGLANGTEYTFTVTATNPAGTGDPSAPSNPVTPSPS